MDSSLIEYPQAVLTKVNSKGETEWTKNYDWLAPVPDIIEIDGNFAFAAVDAQNNGYLISINPSDGEVINQTVLDVTMPLVLYKDSLNRLVVLGYNYIERTSLIAVFNSGGSLINKSEVKVNDDMVTLVQSHMNKSGQEQPFFIGEYSGGYFINCLANYTLRTIFTDRQGIPAGGDVYSFQARDAISSLLNCSGNTYALTRYYAGYNYIAPSVEVDPSQSQNFNDFDQSRMNELVPEAKVKGIKAEFEGKQVLLFAASTNSNSVVIYEYSLENHELIRSSYVAFNDRIEICDLIQDSSDKGILVLGKLYFTGKYLRPVLVKVPAKDFKKE
jgi:hypothetical protein